MAVFAVAAIPHLNILALTIIPPVGAVATYVALVLFRIISGMPERTPSPPVDGTTDAPHDFQRLERVEAAKIGSGVSSLAIIVLLVVTTEKTIQANNVSSGEAQWTLGQIFALAVAIVPCVQLALALFGRKKPEDPLADRSQNTDMNLHRRGGPVGSNDSTSAV
jgi:hypothetical protein